MDACRIHFRVLIAGGLAMAPPVPAESGAARMTAEPSVRGAPGARAEEYGAAEAEAAEGRR